MKRFLAILTAAVLCLALIPPAYAETPETKDPMPRSAPRTEFALTQEIIRSKEDIPAALPAPAPVQPTANIASGTCGDNLNWTLSGTGVLTITGTGEMSFPTEDDMIVVPWENYCDRIIRVVLPEGITSIDRYAFAECYRLTSINLPDSITSIGAYAFYDCISLAGHLTLPANRFLDGIGDYTFFNCVSLTGVTFPQDLSQIGTAAFAGCINLSDLVLPEGLVNIFDLAFAYCVSLTETTLPEGLAYMGGSAFGGCSGIREVKISDNNADFCTDGKAIYRRNNNILVAWVAQAYTTYVVPDGILKISDQAFALAENLTSVTIPASVTDLGKEAFSSCMSLTGLALPAKLQNIGSYCFEATGLTSLTIPANVFLVGEGICHACYDLAVLRVDSANQLFTTDGRSLLSKDRTVLYEYCTPGIGGTYRVPSNVGRVERLAFAGSLVENVIFSRIVGIGSYAFASCLLLRSVSMPAATNDNIYNIAEYAFYGCANLAYMTIPEGIESLGSYAFAGCTSLTGVTLPNTLRYLNGLAFYGCTALNSIYIPCMLYYINEGVFYGCDHLSVIAFGAERPITISSMAFYEITADVYYPKNIDGWSEVVSQQYEGHITWKSYTSYTPLRFTRLPADATQAVGTTAKFSVTATGSGLKYQWQQLSSDGEWADTTLTGAKTATLSVPVTAARHGTYYRCVITDSAGTQAISNAARLAVNYNNAWLQEDGQWYYYVNGVPVAGWREISSRWYYFDTSGAMVKLWRQIDGKWYYFKDNGAMVTGWQQVGSKWYYFQDDGAMATGWLQIGSKWYYFKDNGAMAVGWQQVSGKWYYFKDNGAMATLWQQIGGKWYYFKDNGAMAVGWQKVGDKWYYFKDSGAMQTGWWKINNVWYYFKDNGAMATGWLKLNNSWYYFQGSGAMVSNTDLTINGKTYHFDASGVCTNP